MELLQEFNRILIPLDGSKLSENALKYGVSIAGKYKASVILATVFSSKKPDRTFKNRIKEMDPELAREIEKMPFYYVMENYHNLLRGVIGSQKIPVRSVLRDSDFSTKSVVKVLLDVIEKEKIDLVVISTHGRSGLKKLTLGSVTEGLIKAVSIPVICVRNVSK